MDIDESSKQVSREDAENWCLENGELPLIETSAKTAINVQEAFEAAVASWVKIEAKIERPIITDTVDLSKQQSPQRTSCCMPITSPE